MKRKILAAGLIATALFILTAGGALAKARFNMIGISGPGLDGLLTYTDPETTELLATGRLEAFDRPLEGPPETLEEGYAITRYPDLDNFVPWDQVIYYRNPAGEGGSVYYAGLFNGSSEYDGRWFEAQPESEQYLLDLLAAEGAFLQHTPPAGRSLFYTAIGIGAAAFLGLGWIIVSARRQADTTSQSATDPPPAAR